LKRLFGTDGIRGTAGKAPLDVATIEKVAAALTRLLREDGGLTHVLIGRDTRESGLWIESALARGVAAEGGEAAVAGVVTTAGVAFLTREGGYGAGIMISASHNPFDDNGIKIFSRDGFKLPDDQEARIESLVLDEAAPGSAPPAAAPGRAREDRLASSSAEILEPYLLLLTTAAEGASLEGMRVVLDCANGAACGTAAEAFRRLGAEVHTLSDAPDGRNINEGCGSLHPEALCREVVAFGADAGFAFDGDADRCIGADETGRVCDGDFFMYRAALAYKEAGRLEANTVVGTVMSNLWLERALTSHGIELLRAKVGDKYVLEEMVRTGARIGGEQSGHVIFRDFATTGDGILTAVILASMLKRSGVKLSAWRSEVKPCPQVLLNVRVSSRPRFEEHPAIRAASERTIERLGSSGRLLLRYSGTEPLARVMIEGEDGTLIESLAQELAGVIEQEIGER